MIDHVTIPVSSLGVSRRFYEAAFAPLGFKVTFGQENVYWAFDVGQGLFEIAQAAESAPICSFHIAFRAASRELVHAFHAAAIQAGGRCNGAPGPRPEYTAGYYACFVLDPDGHNIEAVFDVWKEPGGKS